MSIRTMIRRRGHDYAAARAPARRASAAQAGHPARRWAELVSATITRRRHAGRADAAGDIALLAEMPRNGDNGNLQPQRAHDAQARPIADSARSEAARWRAAFQHRWRRCRQAAPARPVAAEACRAAHEPPLRSASKPPPMRRARCLPTARRCKSSRRQYRASDA